MTESSIVCWADPLFGSCAVVALILLGLGTMMGLVKPSDCAKHFGIIVVLTIILVLLVTVFVGLWSTMTLLQRLVLAAIVFAIGRIQHQRHVPSKKRKED